MLWAVWLAVEAGWVQADNTMTFLAHETLPKDGFLVYRSQDDARCVC